MKFGKKIAATLLGILCAGCVAGGLTACKAKGPTETPDDATTYRLALPNDGSAPTAHTGLENIGYMAYALDRQDYYHAYAYCASKAMGYTQVTQTWKDYKDSVMICSDITYSSLVKAGTQACFVNNEVYMRTSETPGKSTDSTSANWKTSKPTYYDRAKYLKTYGEYSTEVSVYIINKETIKSWGEVVDNGDGTYTQSFSLNSKAASYYQYGMKTRGDLKGFPEFNSIEISFTFDSNWTVLSSYCEEKTKIAPSSLGGIAMDSTAKVTTTFSYGDDQFDNMHYGYYDSYYKQYLGKVDDEQDEPASDDVDILNVLGSAFSGVLAGGEQFNAELTVGQTDYSGKIYLSLASIEDILGSIDARISLGRKDGKQDLYIDFAGGAVNAYYSDEFAMTLNVDAVSTIINQFKEWAERFKKDGASAASYALTEEEQSESEGFDIASVLGMFKEEHDDSTVTISVETDDLLGTGIGVRLYMHFDRDGSSYKFNNIELESITYDSTSIDLRAKISPDKDGEIISHNKADAPANLADYAAGVHSMLDSDTLKVTLDFDGSKQNVIDMLSGLSVKAQAYVELGYDIATRVDLDVAYAGLNAELAVYYGNNIDFKSAGKIYLELLKVNGEEMGAKIYCDIDETVDAVKELLSLINNSQTDGSLTEDQSGEAAKSVADIINGILNLNFGEVLGDIYASNSQIRVSCDVDAIVNALGVNVNGVKFGTVALALGLTDGKANLSLTLAALGLDMRVEGSGEQVVLPDRGEYLDAAGLIKLVSVAVKEAGYIIDAKTVAFEIDGLVVIDNMPMQIVGGGEVSWNGGLKIAVDAVMTIADGTSASSKDEVALKLFYDAAAEEGKPFVKFAVNSLGMEIYDKDITDTKNGIQNIIDSVNLLINGEKSGNATASSAVGLYNTSVNLDGGNIGAAVEEIVASNNFQKILGAVLGFVKDLSVSTDYDVEDGSVSKLMINHALYGNLTLTANGSLALDANITDENGTQILDVYAGVKAGNGSGFDRVNSALENCEIYSTAQTEDAFAKIVYNYLFAVVENELSVSQTLGSNTYEVAIHLDGANSEIPALKEITADATLYYTQGLAGDKIKGDKLAEIDLVLNIGATAVNANVRYNDEKIYISLDKIGTTNLNEIKFYAAKDDISLAVEELVRLITDENVIKTLSKLIHPAESKAAASSYEVARVDENALSDLIAKLISFDFANTISFNKVDGVNTATVNIDNILKLFGTDLGFEIGTAKIGVDPKTHAVTGSVSVGGRDWINLSAEKAARRVYADNWQAAYINAGFVPTLISDLYKTVTDDNGEFYTLYTFAGRIDIAVKVSVGISINKNIEMNVTSLTVGLDQNGQFYLTVLADLKGSSVLGFTLASANRISITYSNGYVTFGKGVGTADAVYKVMTLDYLLENAFVEHSGGVDSPIRWLIGMSDSVWNIIAGAVPSLVSDGTPTYTLYETLANASASDGNFYLTQFLTGFAIDVNGSTVTSFGSGTAAADALGFGENYYALQLNANGLTGGVLNSLYVGLTRNDEQGITGIKAIGSLSASPATVNLTIDLNEYKEGVTNLYESGELTGEYAAPNYYNVVTENYEIDFNKTFESSDEHIEKVFGCYTTGEENPYASVNKYTNVTLTVEYGDMLKTAYGQLGLELNEDGVYFRADDIAYSSIVYLRTPFAPTWVNDEHTYKIIYTTDREGNNRITDQDDGRIYMQLWGDTTIYAQVEKSVKINFVTGVDGVGTVTGGFVDDAQLIEYSIGGYTFLGWYADKDFTVKTDYANDANIVKVDGVPTVYGKYMIAEMTVNGVVYAYTDNAYEVKAFDEYAIKPYTESGSTLVLESNINGYPVTSIAANALKSSMVKNVVVPETVTSVGAQAFMDNYAIESVVFLAKNVTLGGNGVKGDSRYVFFGCSEASGGKTTKLHVYYTNITCPGGDWTEYRDGAFIQRSGTGGLHSANWAYVEYKISGNGVTQLGCLASGVVSDGLSANQIKTAAIDELNRATASKGYINGYEVSVDNGFAADNKYYTVNVTINTATPYYYLLTVDIEGAVISGDACATFGNDNAVYAQAGTTVTVTPPDGYEFVSLSGVDGIYGDASGYKFDMPTHPVSLNGEVREVEITSVIIHSAVDYIYDGVSYAAGYNLTVDGVEQGVTQLGTISAEGYLFLGWAYEKGSVLEFTSSTVQYVNYYAIWADGRDGMLTGVKDGAVLTSGTDPNAVQIEVDSSVADSFYAWYLKEDAEFHTKITNLDKNTTVLYPRVFYSLNYSVSGGAAAFIFENVPSDQCDKNNATQEAGKSFTGKIAMLENGTYSVKRELDGDTQIEIYYTGVNGLEMFTLRVKKKTLFGGVGGSYSLNTDGLVNSATANGNVNLSVTF